MKRTRDIVSGSDAVLPRGLYLNAVECGLKLLQAGGGVWYSKCRNRGSFQAVLEVPRVSGEADAGSICGIYPSY
jgi:hypothetical protein